MDRPEKPRKESLLLAAQHQLRQPLNALSLLIGELKHGASGRELDAIADNMRIAVQLQTAWLDALGELEAAALGALESDAQPVALQPVFASLAAEVTPRFAALGLELRVVATRAVVRADAALLRRVLALLLDNAAKFIPAGKVLLGCRQAGGRVRIELRDSGPGMTSEEAERVFEPFFRLENEVRPREGGLGVGLATARRLAQLAGGRLALAARPGRGCCFRLTLQAAARSSAAPAPENAVGTPPDPLAGAEVALLEGPLSGALREQLTAWGVTVRTVAQGELVAALAAAPRLLLADRDAFTAAGAPHGAGAATVIVLVGEVAPGRSDSPGVHSLGLPLRPARLRALCHYALTRP